jgi:hypothetical protein
VYSLSNDYWGAFEHKKLRKTAARHQTARDAPKMEQSGRLSVRKIAEADVFIPRKGMKGTTADEL